jgi:hypothetical protein
MGYWEARLIAGSRMRRLEMTCGEMRRVGGGVLS